MGPFIAADGKTMYFASKRSTRAMKARDIFVTVRQDDSWLNWSPPRNLGKPINSAQHDSFFQVTAKGDSGYYSSQANSTGGYDVFQYCVAFIGAP